MGAAKKSLSEEARVDDAVMKARGALQERGAVAGAKLGAPGIRPRVVERLLRDGYEMAGKGVRVPLLTQADALLEGGAHIPLATLSKRLAGASKKEAEALARDLCKAGRAHLVLRGKQVSVVPAAEPVLDRADLAKVARELQGNLDWIKKALAHKLGATVLRRDLGDAVEEVAARVRKWESPPRGRAAVPGETGLSLALRGAVLALRDEESLLASVPQVSRRLRERATAEEVQAELLVAYRRGELELRPEGGLGRLSADDAALCPLGAGGVPLGWVRLLEGEP